MIISRSFLLRMRNGSDKICIEYKKNKFHLQNLFFFENLAFYEICGKIWYSQTNNRRLCNKTQALCMLVIIIATHKLRLSNACCFFIATVVVRKGHNMYYVNKYIALLFIIIIIY